MENLGTNDKQVRRQTRRRHAKALGGIVGAAAGAAIGALSAGPVGAVVGAVTGTAMGAAAGWAAQLGTTDAADRDSQLDIDIGVHGGDLGAPNLEHPPSQIGAYSRAASGVGRASEARITADGPIQPPPE